MRVFALILINLFILAVVGPLLLVFNLQTTYLSSPAQLKQTLVRTDVYNRLDSLSAEDVSQLLSNEQRDPESQISNDQIQLILNFIPASTMQKVTEQGLDGYFDALKLGKPTVAIDIRDIKQQALASMPAEFLPEISKSIPDIYEINVKNKNAKLWTLMLNPYSKYIGMALLGLLLLLAILLGVGAKGKLSAVATPLLISGLVALTLYYILKIIPVEKLLEFTSNTSSQKLLAILQDVLAELRKPIVGLFRLEWIYSLGASVLLFIIALIVSARKVIVNAPPMVPAHMSQNQTPPTPPAATS